MHTSNNTILQILKQSKGATAIYDTCDIRIAFVNKAMFEIWGRNDDIIGQHFGIVFPEFTEQGFTAILKKVWKSGVTYEATDFPANITLNGHVELRYFDFIYQAILDNEGKTYAIIHTATDVTERRHMVKRVEEQNAFITFNNELEILTRTLSHDLKNPLSIAKIGAQYIANKDVITETEKKKWISIILDGLKSIEQIITHKMQLNQARVLNYENKRIILKDTIRKICTESQALYDSKDCIFEIGHLEDLHGDEGIIQQIFFNIIGNAVKYSSKTKSPIVKIASCQEHEQIVYTIVDNGIGIPSEEKEEIFLQFKRASNTGGFPGRGIGLCVVKKIMNRIKGKITLSSEEGKGTVVRLFFPIGIDGNIWK